MASAHLPIGLLLLGLLVQSSSARALPQHHWGAEGCVLVKSAYVPSKMESAWLATAGTVVGPDQSNLYCNHVNSQSAAIDTWLSGVNQVSQRPANNDVFSRFTHHLQCGNRMRRVHSWIEPLFGAMRHPRWLCLNGDILSREYLLVENSLTFDLPSYTPRRTFYFDLGASLYKSGAGGASQEWLIEAYKVRGVTFDRMLLWEALPHETSLIMRDVPKDMMHAYQYINLPATADVSDAANPFNIIKRITLPSDFVVVKLDIDHPETEAAFITQILQDKDIMSRIDEMFYEHHINFKPLVDCCWGKGIDQNTTLSDSVHLFQHLRHQGIRMHGWP